MDDADIDAFMEWFQSNGGFIDMQAMGVTEFPGSGRGAIALRDIPKGCTLFTLPRTLTLSTRTSPLPSLFGSEAWRACGLHKGWMEADRTRTTLRTQWGPYIRTLPTTFDTPMFWSAVELEELRGTAVLDKIGRDDAERAYSEQLVPAIKTSPTLFPPSHYRKWYTLDAYHRAGSRILSRSFTVSRWTDDDVADRHSEAGKGGSHADEAEDPDPKPLIQLSGYIDDAQSSLLQHTNEGLDSDSEDGEDHDPSDIAMVPMADLLNARWGSENAKLFYEPVALRMVSTKNISQGEQIFNTYGDPPNSDLLRRYGHVDLVQLHSSLSVPTPDRHGNVEMEDGDTDVETIKYLGNPSDVAEIRADLVVHVVQTTDFGLTAKDYTARIEWWIDEGEDDTFLLSLPNPGSHLSAILPPELVSLIRLLTLSEVDFESARLKGKLPKGQLKMNSVEDNKEVLEILDEVLKQREGMYVGGSVEDDERLLSNTETLTNRKRHAVIVRLGEKRILKDARKIVRTMVFELSSTSGAGCKDDTRRRGHQGGNDGGESGSSKKRVFNESERDCGRKKGRK